MSFDEDPFAQREKTPAVSWADAPIGAEITMRLDGKANKVQQKDFETGQPATWKDGNPKYSAVVSGTIVAGPNQGEKRSLWAPIPSALFAAIGAAQTKAGVRLDKDGLLTVRLTGRKPNEKNPRFKPSNQFAAKYEPSATSDPWAAPGESGYQPEQPPF